MKKIKKILLAFAPLTAIAIATPIVLTACSDTTTNTTTPDDNNSGSGNTQNPAKPSFSKDNTNSNSFQLEANSKAQEILNNYKAAKGQAAAEKILTDELAGFPKKDSGTLAKDVLNMWSNNNWFTITQTAKDTKVKETFISSLTINKAEVDSMSKATFDVEYKSAFNDSTGKLYEATQVLKADKVQVDASTKIEIPKEIPGNSYKIDGKDQPLTSTSLFATEASDPKTNLENNLKQNKVSLDAKQIFQTFITNHNILHAEEDKPSNQNVKGLWVDEIQKPTGIVVNNEKTEINADLTKITGTTKWYMLNSTSTKNDVISAIVKDNKLTETFKALITNKEAFSDFPVTQMADDGQNKVTFTIKPTKKTKEEVAQPDLKIIVTYSSAKPVVNEGTWADSVKTIASKATINTQKTQIDVLLNNFTDSEEWYTLKKGSTETNVRNVIYTTTSGVNNLTDTFKNLVNGKENFKSMTVSPSVDATKKILSFVITLTKNDNTTKSLKINIRFKA